MRRTHPHSSAYGTRLTLGFTMVVAMLAVAWAWSLFAPLDAAVRDQQRQRLTDLARAGAVAAAHGDVPLAELVELLGADTSVRLTVVAANGEVLADSQETTSALENHADRPEVRDALAGRTGTDVRRSSSQGVERLYVAVPLTLPDGSHAAFRTSESLQEIASLAARTRRMGLVFLAVAVLLAAFASWRFTSSVARPVDALADVSRAMAAGDLGAAIPADAGPLSPLADALGALRAQLRERLDALEGERRTLRVALDGLEDGVLLVNGDRVELVNRSLGSIFRLPPGDIVGRTLAELGLPAPIEAAATRPTGSSATVTDLGPDPFQRYHRVLVVPLDSDSAGRRLVAVSDVTDRMRLDAVRRDFAVNASHELKTPAASILLLAESAENAAADGDAQQAIAFIGQIADEARRLRRLVNDLLDLSRLETVPGEDEVADVRRAVELALAGHRRSASMKSLELSADLDQVAGVDVAVRCGVTDLAIILDNLLANAITYTETGRVVVRVAADDASVEIEVSDTGIGIPAEDVGRVFERFYRVDRARSRTSGGTGLGLALVKNIAEKCEGTVGISSTVGSGTTVSVRLPRAV